MKQVYSTLIFSLFVLPLAAQLSVGTNFNYQLNLSTSGVESATAPQGLSVQAFYRCSESPLSFGIEVGQRVYNHQSYGATFQDAEHGLVSTDIKEKDALTQVHLITRYHFSEGSALEPYAEGRLGTISTFTGRNVSEGVSVASREEVMSANQVRDRYSRLDHHHTGIQAGIGVGTIISLKRLVCATVEDLGFELKLDTGVTYYLSSNAGVSTASSETNRPLASQNPVNNLNLRFGILLAFK